jgi:hypothetical protein
MIFQGMLFNPALCSNYDEYQNYLSNLSDLRVYLPVYSNTPVQDISGNNVSYESWGVSYESAGIHGAAMDFKGDSGARLMHEYFLPDKSFSLVLWVNPSQMNLNEHGQSTNIAGNFTIDPDYTDQGVFGFALELTSDLRPRARIGGGSSKRIYTFTALDSIPYEDWTFLALVWDDKTQDMRIYVNGKNLQPSEIAEKGGNFIKTDKIIHYSPKSWAIGQDFDNNMRYIDQPYILPSQSTGRFTGLIDELIIFSRPITAHEAFKIYRYTSDLRSQSKLDIPQGPWDLYGKGVVYSYQGLDRFDLLKYRNSGTSWFTLSFTAKTTGASRSPGPSGKGTPCAAFRLTTDIDTRYSKNGRWWSDQRAEVAVVDDMAVTTPSFPGGTNIAIRAGAVELGAKTSKFKGPGSKSMSDGWKRYYMIFPINWKDPGFTFKRAEKDPAFIKNQALSRNNMRGIIYFYNASENGKALFENIQLEVSSKKPSLPSAYSKKDQIVLKYNDPSSKNKALNNIEAW